MLRRAAEAEANHRLAPPGQRAPVQGYEPGKPVPNAPHMSCACAYQLSGLLTTENATEVRESGSAQDSSPPKMRLMQYMFGALTVHRVAYHSE